MMTSLILAAALAAQAPATHAGPKTDAELRAMMAQINARVAKANKERWRDELRREAFLKEHPKKPEPAAAVKPEPAAAKPYVPYFETSSDRKANLRRQVAAMEQAQAEAARRYQIEAQAQYERMLPYMLENQRQMLNRQSQLERNAIAQENAETYRRSMQALEWRLMQQRAR